MSIDYLVTSLPALRFGEPAPITWERFCETVQPAIGEKPPRAWQDLDTQLRNALAEARGGDRYKRPAVGCSLYWQKRILDCFTEKDVKKRDELIDRVWWDAAGELTSPCSPLGKGALETYAVRLKIALRRSRISPDVGNAAFDRLTASTKITFQH